MVYGGATFQAGQSWAYLGWDSTDWEIVGTADFNNDGNTDILMTNTGNGADSRKNKVWFMNKNIPESKPTPIKSRSDVDWKIVETADFDGDADPDILWRNETIKDDYNTVIWLMEGVKFIKTVYLPSNFIPEWKVVGAGDFNGDYHSDVLWRNTATGQNIVWYVKKGEYKDYDFMPAEHLDWEVGETGDLNDDGKMDILWRNTKTGWNAVWYMNGAAGSKSDKPWDWLPSFHLDFKMVGTGSFQ